MNPGDNSTLESEIHKGNLGFFQNNPVERHIFAMHTHSCPLVGSCIIHFPSFLCGCMLDGCMLDVF